MKFNDIIVTKVEVDRKCFIYNDWNSISFSEIEEEIRKRTQRLHISVYGEYSVIGNIEPFVYLQVTFEGYKYRIILEKRAFKDKNAESYYDWLVDNIIHQFTYKLFMNNLESKGDCNE